MSRPFSRFQHGQMNTLSRNEGISLEDLRAFAPAIFVEQKSAERSERYTHVSTLRIHDEMTKAGFYPVKVIKSTGRQKDDEDNIAFKERQQFMKHMIMYRHPDALTAPNSPYFGQVGYVGDHAGKCSIQMFAGLLEVLCGNGLIAGKVAEAIRLSHVSLDIRAVIAAAFKMMEALGIMSEWRGTLQSIPVDYDTKLTFAREAMKLRWETGKEPIKPTQLLEMRRVGDTTENLWGLYNVVEENLRVGGLIPYAAYERNTELNKQGKRGVRPTIMRGVKGLEGNIDLETGLSDLTEEFRKFLTKAA